MIQIDTNLFYDESLGFDNQSMEVNSFILELMSNTPDYVEEEVISGDIKRPIKLEWNSKNSFNYKITEVFEYLNPVSAPGWAALRSVTKILKSL